jgi:hypothetical protein
LPPRASHLFRLELLLPLLWRDISLSRIHILSSRLRVSGLFDFPCVSFFGTPHLLWVTQSSPSDFKDLCLCRVSLLLDRHSLCFSLFFWRIHLRTWQTQLLESSIVIICFLRHFILRWRRRGVKKDTMASKEKQMIEDPNEVSFTLFMTCHLSLKKREATFCCQKCFV